MNKNALITGAVVVALIAAGPIYAVQNKNAKPATTLASDTAGSSTHSSDARSDDRVIVPNGTAMRFKLSSGLYTKTSNLGDTFEATLASPVSVSGHVVIPEGATVAGHVILVKQPGKASGRV